MVILILYQAWKAKMDKAALSTLAKSWKEGAWEIRGVVLKLPASGAKNQFCCR